ncbi:hypothetical protein [Mammaliicoccus sciuri]|uniref:hypothetical protein n=1 Tax=Mammaliicoccus sciuri TaxID=1296 RepID=UPI001E578A2E|nr:hypothetical protein [Mammaliicoccus sciuri]MCD8898464.1 hypothetical protein [Mammaliicoccus sciuri]
MTSEICIMNTEGVVLAADSAVTISGGNEKKTYNTVNKLFSMDKHNVGIMINGNATFNYLPLELIIKEYKKNLEDIQCSDINDYVTQFISFLDEFPESKSQYAELEFINQYVQELDILINRESEIKINAILEKKGQIAVEEVNKIFIDTISDNHEQAKEKGREIFEYEHDYIKENYHRLIENYIKNKYQKQYINDEFVEKFISFIDFVIKTDLMVANHSSIIFAGYGKNDVLPSMVELDLMGSFDNKIKHFARAKETISIEYNKRATITPFAQTDMIETIIKGVHPSITNKIIDIFMNLEIDLDRKKEMISKIETFQSNYFIIPFLNTIEHLPLVELPSVAETLINITSFKKKYSSNVETVGGPVDILTITKGEGPIWINRKHYFDSSNNLEYLNRKGDRNDKNY